MAERDYDTRFVKYGITLLAIMVLLFAFSGFKQKKYKSVQFDVVEYYQYLPGLFVHHDLNFGFLKQNTQSWGHKFWLLKSPTGRTVGRMSIGMAMVYMPFFLAAHALAPLLGFAADGFSLPYQVSVVVAGLFYFLAGLYLLALFLLRYFKPYPIFLGLLILIFGSNLYHYLTSETGMPHVAGFGLLAAFIYFTARYFDSPSIKRIIVPALLYGLICLIRPSGVIAILLFVLYDVSSVKILKSRILFLVSHLHHLAVMIALFLVVWFPQLLYWKIQTGSWLFFTYGLKNEAFFFTNPQIINQLFSYRNGWLVYSPIMVLAFTGLFISYKRFKGLANPVLIYMLLNIYILSSWWCWWFVSFGNRAYIESYALMAIPMVGFISFVIARIWFYRVLFTAVIGLFVFINFLQTNQFRNGALHYDSMTKEAYWYHFFTRWGEDGYYRRLVPPDYAYALKGIYFKHDNSSFIDFPEYKRDLQVSDSLLGKIKKTLMSDPKLVEMIKTKAEQRKISFDDMLSLDAQWIFQKKYNLPRHPAK